MKGLAVVVLFCSTLLGSGCPTPPITPLTSETTPVATGGEWKNIAANVDRLDYHFAALPEARVLLYRFAPDAFQWRFEASSTPLDIGSWSERFPQASIVVNSVYFHEDYSPSGLLISKGERIGSRQFDVQKTGLIQLSPRVRLISTTDTALKDVSSTEMAQSYPFFVLKGKPAISEDSRLLARRSFFGVDVTGHIYIGIVPEQPISLHQLMIVLDQMPVEWESVMNLDGGPSSGLSLKTLSSTELIPSLVPVPIVIVGERF